MPVEAKANKKAVDYGGGAPASYACGNCGARECKLWREYNVMASHQTLRCAPCALAAQAGGKGSVDADGRRIDRDGDRSDQIGWLVPAVPTEDGKTFWGYSSVPDDGVAWWRRLPSYPKEATS